MSRAQMLMFALLTMHLLLGVLVLAVAWSERRSRALRLWGSGLLAYALGALFIIAVGLVPWGVRQVVGDSLISLSALLTSLAAYQHTQIHLSRTTIVGSFAFIVAVLVVNHLLNITVFIDIAAPTVYASVLFLVAAIALLVQPPAVAKAAARYLAFSIIATIVIWNLRMYGIWHSLGGTSDTNRADYVVSMFAIAQMLLLVAATLGLLWIEVRLIEADLQRSAYTDFLTNLPNRRAMLLRFHEQLSSAQRQQQTFGFVVIDLDHFKRVNDTHGHHAGDELLRHVAETLKRGKRGEDILGRIGGEEFLLFLPHHDRKTAELATDRLRAAVQSAIPLRAESASNITLSAGIAMYPDDGKDWDSLFMAADRRLYLAKRRGRNRIESLDDPAAEYAVD
ncbi:MAG TPA: GGDEF domain-containing protein [Gammaproteobacteria bacterium]|nr:GGDEF domain-containing protein [Gammaproteobacteria bacterium]